MSDVNRPSLAQMEKLVEFMEYHPQLAMGMRGNHARRRECRNKWAQLTRLLNSMDGAIRDAKQWSRFWSDRKYAIKRRLISRRYAREYGTQRSLAPSLLSEIDIRVLQVSGMQESLYSFMMNDELNPRNVAEEEPIPAAEPIPTQMESPMYEEMHPNCKRITVRRPHIDPSTDVQRAINLEHGLKQLGWQDIVICVENLVHTVEQCGQLIVDSLNSYEQM